MAITIKKLDELNGSIIKIVDKRIAMLNWSCFLDFDLMESIKHTMTV